MDFDKVEREHILQGIKDFEEKGIPKGFKNSTTYNVNYKGKVYPPKVIMVYANYHAAGREIEWYFQGGEGTECFNVLEEQGFVIEKKNKRVNYKENFIKWLNKNFNKESGSRKSYVIAIDLLEKPLGYNVFTINDLNKLNLLYKDLLKEQKNKNGKYYNSEVPSYGLKGFYSAGIKKYIEFLKDTQKSNKQFTWVKTHLALADYLKDYKNKQVELINLLKSVGVVGYKDKDDPDNEIELQEIDPFTFYCYIYKYGPERRLHILQEIAKKLDIHYPEDELGIPSSNAQMVWLFPYKYLRVNNEIERLWSFFFKALEDNIANESFADLLKIRGIARTKLTEALFNINPKIYFPINGPTKIFIKEVFDIDPKFKSFEEYLSILKELRVKTDKPFYQLSYEAWLWNVNNEDVVKEQNTTYENNNRPMSKNLILYGPPGTGKTFNTINEAIKICNPSFDLNVDREYINEEFKRLVAEDQVVFTTFHQSMSYEEFIEGIKPITENGKVTYEVQDGIFKDLCLKAKGISGFKSTVGEIDFENVSYFKMSLGGKNRKNVHDWCLQNNMVALGWGGNTDYSILKGVMNWNKFKEIYTSNFPELVEESKYNVQAAYCFINWMKEGDVVLVSLGNKVIDAIGVIEGEYEYVEDSKFPYHHQRKVKWLIKDMDSSPKLFVDKNISQQTIYKFDTDDIKIDAFKNQFTNEINSEEKNFVMIIDEINRGNVSSIFGELITLIELDKRKGTENEISLALPYSKEEFSVPKNVSIIGTMNTADRSVEALDTALRRRFSFKEMMPKTNLLNGVEVSGIQLDELLEKINDRIEVLLDRDHTIGHSYFLKVKEAENKEKTLEDVFKDNIIPLLQEYFFGDYSKIGLILGKEFVEVNEQDSSKILANFDIREEIDLDTKYTLKSFEDISLIDAIKSI